jgi:PAS domain S-box-containing protein
MKHIKILLIEDDLDNSELTKIFLSKNGQFTVDIKTTNFLSTAISLLKENTYDLILLDLILPNSHGIDTIKSIRDADTDTPLIIVSGYEDMAIEAARHGAQDYLIKGIFTPNTLIKSITYVLERDKFKHKLMRRDKKILVLCKTLQQIIDCSKTIIWTKNMDSKLIFVNKQFADSFNTDKNHFVGKKVYEITEYNSTVTENDDKKVMKSGETMYFKDHLIINGIEVWWDVCKSPLKDDKGNIIGIVGHARDITDKVKRENDLIIILQENIDRWNIDRKEMQREIGQSILNIKNEIGGCI